SELNGQDHLNAADAAFEELLATSRRNISRDKCLRLLKDAKSFLVSLEGVALIRGARKQSGARTFADDLILESLDDLCPSAAQSYRQALVDLGSESRTSYRGPATDLREALRETLDML